MVALVALFWSFHPDQGCSKGCYAHQVDQAGPGFCLLVKLVNSATDQVSQNCVPTTTTTSATDLNIAGFRSIEPHLSITPTIIDESLGSPTHPVKSMRLPRRKKVAILHFCSFDLSQRTFKACTQPPHHTWDNRSIWLMGLTFPLSRGWRGLATLLDDARYFVPDNREAGLFHPVGNGNFEPICQVDLLLPGPQVCAFLEKHLG